MEENTLRIAAAVLVIWNLAAFMIMGLDKRRAEKGKNRISESTLLLIAFAMGGTGVLAGMPIWHHKTRKAKFLIGVPVAVAVNLLAIYGGLLMFKQVYI